MERIAVSCVSMTLAIQLTVRGAQYSQPLAEIVRKRAQKLETFSQGITGCRVAFDLNTRGEGAGDTCNVTLVLTVPGDAVVVHHRYRGQGTREMSTGVNRLFSLAERALRKHEQRRRAFPSVSRAGRQGRRYPRTGHSVPYFEATGLKEKRPDAALVL